MAAGPYSETDGFERKAAFHELIRGSLAQNLFEKVHQGDPRAVIGRGAISYAVADVVGVTIRESVHGVAIRMQLPVCTVLC